MSDTLKSAFPLFLDACGNDIDGDELTLSAQGDGFNLQDIGIDFNGNTGVGTVVSPFLWTPDCGIFGEGESGEKTVTIIFRGEDTPRFCQSTPNSTEYILHLKVQEEEEGGFLPANAFSPNGDGVGDEFYLDNLPLNNCQRAFGNIEIYNRWGRQVYRSSDRNFRWTAQDLPAGVYFYKISYSDGGSYEGTVSVFRD